MLIIFSAHNRVRETVNEAHYHHQVDTALAYIHHRIRRRAANVNGAGDQRLNRRWRSAEENHLRIQTLLVEEALLPGDPKRPIPQSLTGRSNRKFHFFLGSTGQRREDQYRDDDTRSNPNSK